jgi:hypothetical protein
VARLEWCRDGAGFSVPKVFGVPADLPGVSVGQRDIDVFLSGVVTHPYHIDKEAIVLDVLGVEDIPRADGAGIRRQ